MADTVKFLKPLFVAPCEVGEAFWRIFKEVEREARTNLTLPPNPTEAQLALRVMNDVFDRLEEAICKHIESLPKKQS